MFIYIDKENIETKAFLYDKLVYHGFICLPNINARQNFIENAEEIYIWWDTKIFRDMTGTQGTLVGDYPDKEILDLRSIYVRQYSF